MNSIRYLFYERPVFYGIQIGFVKFDLYIKWNGISLLPHLRNKNRLGWGACSTDYTILPYSWLMIHSNDNE
jgi:hypothetical protein